MANPEENPQSESGSVFTNSKVIFIIGLVLIIFIIFILMNAVMQPERNQQQENQTLKKVSSATNDASKIIGDRVAGLTTAQNSDYYETPNVVSLFEDHFRKPETGDEVLLMSPTEIIVALKLNPENHSNVTLLGLYLRRKGFLHGEGRQRRCYQVAVNTK